MRQVKVVKSSKTAWYYDLIGCTFSAWEHNKDSYAVCCTPDREYTREVKELPAGMIMGDEPYLILAILKEDVICLEK